MSLTHVFTGEVEDKNVPFFLVLLKDTELLENTFFRFIIKVQGEPKPKVKL